MSEKENEAEQVTREFLKSQGFNVRRIVALPTEQRADYQVTDKDAIYIVEVKGRVKDEIFEQELLERGEAVRQEIVGRINPISACIREAAQQLEATPAESTAFRVMALVAGGTDPQVQAEQFQATLYGMVNLLMPSADGSADAVPGFYFTFNEFFELRHVDAALIIVPSGNEIATKLCLNTFSPRAPEIQRSGLWELHEQAGAVCHPEQMEARGKAFVADCDLNRRDESAMRTYIRQKYGLEHLPEHLPIPSTPKSVTAARRLE